MRYLILNMMAVMLLMSGGNVAYANNSFADLLQVEAVVEGQSRTERQRELPNLFRQVLVRVSGTTQVLENSIIANEVSAFNDYLVQFGYQSIDSEIVLQVSFDERRVRDLLRRAGVPIWTGERPQLLLWLAENSDERGVRLIGRAEDRPFLDGLYGEARRRGIRMLMPLMDLEDQMAVGARDVWGRFQREVTRASQRYPVAGIVSARMYETDLNQRESFDDLVVDEPDVLTVEPLNMGVALEATIVIGDMQFIEYFTAEDEETVARKFVNHVTDRVAALFIGESNQESEVISVRFSGFENIGQLLAAEQMLQQQGQVYRVHLARYQQGMAEFTVQVSGGVSWLKQALEFERRVQVVANEEQALVSENEDEAEQRVPVLEYTWLR